MQSECLPVKAYSFAPSSLLCNLEMPQSQSHPSKDVASKHRFCPEKAIASSLRSSSLACLLPRRIWPRTAPCRRSETPGRMLLLLPETYKQPQQHDCG